MEKLMNYYTLNIQNNLSTNRDKKDTLNQGIFFLKLDSRG